MEAHVLRLSLIATSLFCSTGATFRTPNFTVTAPSSELAQQVGKAAEIYRKELATFWLGQPLPNWSRPCKLKVRPGSLGAGGETRFQFVGKEVLNWDMYVQGSVERILDSVLPHEVNHTIFACHFRRPLPRWADEGAATLFEHRSEQVKQLGLLNQVIDSSREFIDLSRLLQMKEYPKGYRPMLIMYAEGYALADFLVQQGGRLRYLEFLQDGERQGWPSAIKNNYHHGGIESLEKNWKAWIKAGMPKLRSFEEELVADVDWPHADIPRPAILDEYPTRPTVRSQSPEPGRSRTEAPTRSARPANSEARESEPATVPVAFTRQNSANAHAVVAVNGGTSRSSGHSLAGTGPNTAAADAGLFRGLPVRKPSRHTANAESAVHRQASFEAPQPRPIQRTASPQMNADFKTATQPDSQPTLRTSDRGTENGLFFGSDSSSRPGLARTAAVAVREERSDEILRKHLPQKRRPVTGSTPQWAGFPGQKELF